MSGDHNMNLYGDGTVFRGERSADSKGVTYTMHDLLDAKGVSEPLREAVKVLQRENAELREALEHPSYEEENRLRAELEEWRSVFGHLGTPDEVGNEWHKLTDRLEAAEKERDALRAEVIHIKEVEFPRKAQAVADGWRGKCERLEAKIAEMERQEPVAEWLPLDSGEDTRRG